MCSFSLFQPDRIAFIHCPNFILFLFQLIVNQKNNRSVFFLYLLLFFLSCLFSRLIYQLVISNISVFPSFIIRFPLLNLICIFFLDFLKHFIAILFYHPCNQITTSFKSFIHSTPPSDCIKMVLPDTHFVSHKCFSG